MYLVWCGSKLVGMYPDLWIAKSAARARMGVSHITQQEIVYGTVHEPRHWWFF